MCILLELDSLAEETSLICFQNSEKALLSEHFLQLIFECVRVRTHRDSSDLEVVRMFPNLTGPVRQLLRGDVLMIGCCIFYLLWWVIAFRPVGAVRGLKSGWLLIPAFILGIAALAAIVQGAEGTDAAHAFFTGQTVLMAGVLAYVVLLLYTGIALHRQVTTELFLIVGWTALAFLEVNALCSLGTVSRTGAVALFVLALLFAAVSMVCYLLFYGLDERAGYVDGMVPLILVGIYMLVLAVLIVRAG